MKTLLTLFSAMSILASSALAADPAPSGKTESAIIGGGCFWCTEGQYKLLKGVKKVISGYAGGEVDNPTYKQVCTGTTGHAEVIEIQYDPEIITYKDIIDLFWLAHDPTTLNRQGADEGTQYRSTIMYTSEEQKKIAEASMAEAAKEISGKIVTEIVPLKKFYPAEDYHQDYFANNPDAGYCRVVVGPKVAKFKKKLEEKAKLKEAAKAQ
jgi:peptide-methionine (S)-S-oxide reductase